MVKVIITVVSSYLQPGNMTHTPFQLSAYSCLQFAVQLNNLLSVVHQLTYLRHKYLRDKCNRKQLVLSWLV